MAKGALNTNKATKAFWLIRKRLRFITDSLFRRIYISREDEKRLVDSFHQFYYESVNFGGGIGNLKWMGTDIAKYPTDMWIYQELLNEIKPDVIIEAGTFKGGSALYLANICDMLGKGKIFTIDIDAIKGRPKHKRITYLEGSSTDENLVNKIKKQIKKQDVVMVILDSDHTRAHVLNELRTYHKLVTPGSYLVVEDTSVNGHPIKTYFGEGPMEAVRDFFKENNDFVIDKSREKFLLTANPNGYLRKKTKKNDF